MLQVAEMRGELQAQQKKAAAATKQHADTSDSSLEAMRQELDTAKQEAKQKDSVSHQCSTSYAD